MCDTVAAHPKAKFYAALAVFTRAFVAVEIKGCYMLS
jgi:TorA maturation chaperone TorD